MEEQITALKASLSDKVFTLVPTGFGNSFVKNCNTFWIDTGQ